MAMTPRDLAAIEARRLAMHEEALDARARARPDLVCPGCGAPVYSRTPGARCAPCAAEKRKRDNARAQTVYQLRRKLAGER
jgi:rubrerythrin